MDPIFGYLNDLMIIGGDMPIFSVTMCKVVYFDSHYHSYVVSTTPNTALYSTLYDYNVYHGHILRDGLTYITLKYYFVS